MTRTYLLVGAALAGAVACSEPSGPTRSPSGGRPTLSVTGAPYVRVSPDSATLAPGGSIKLTGYAVPSTGAPYDYSYIVSWASLDPAIATVATAGNVRAVASGRARIVATLNGTADTAVIVVSGVSGATAWWTEVGVRITPDSAVVPAGGSVKLTGSSILGNGTLKDYSYLMRWTSLDTTIAKVEEGGTVRGRRAGRTTVVAVKDGFADTAVVTVPGVGTTTPTTPTPTTASRVDLAATGALAVGGSASFPVVVYDLAGQPVPAPVVTWTSSDPAVMSVGTGGLATGRAHGYAMLIASSGGRSDTMDVTVGAPEQQPDAVTLTLRRFAAGSGTIRATGGIPLRAGWVRPADLSAVRVYVAGREVPIYAEALAGLHADGSLRSVYVELNANLSTAPTAALLRIGTRRLAGDLARGDLSSRGQPAAAVLPSSPDYLVATGIMGRTLTSAQTNALGGAFATWESRFAPIADRLWASEGARWDGNYYDRAHLYFAAWARTGNPEYFRRGAAIAVAYRRDYLEPNNYMSSPHWAQLDGMADHYLLTGDEASRVALGRTTAVLSAYLPALGDITVDARIQARLLTALLLSARLGAPGRSAAEWASMVDTGLEKVLASQRADGSFRFTSTCFESHNYMSGMLNDALVQVYEGRRADSRIVSAVRRSVDFLWNTQAVTSPSVSFKYISASCAGVGDPIPTPDLNGLMVTAFGWLYRQTGDAAYRTRGDQVFAGINSAWIDGSKQFNQAYSQSYYYLGYR